MTAFILYYQFRVSRVISILTLSAAYWYSALIAIPGVLTFPGIFKPDHGLLNAGPQTSTWLYLFWYCGFALLICVFLFVNSYKEAQLSERQTKRYSWTLALLIPFAVLVLTIFSIYFTDLLPPLMDGGSRTPFYNYVAGPITLGLNLLAFAGVILILRGRSVASLFLSLAVLASLVNVVLNTLSGGRYTLGWYVSKVGSFMSANLLLIFLIYEFYRLYLLVRHQTEELAAAKATAELANKAKSSFLANMSHEIRTPIHAVIGLNSLLQRTDLNRMQREYVDKTITAAKSLVVTIDDILDFSKIEANKIVLEQIDFDLYEVMHNISTLVGYKAFDKGLRLHFAIDPHVPQMLKGDPLRLNQVLLNLANNAVKFTEKGVVSVSVEAVLTAEEQIQLRFSVRDTGIGMTQKQLDQLFREFTQADLSTTRKYGGTGLGLVISKSLVELMGGEMSAESSINHGSLFSFTAHFGLCTQVPAASPKLVARLKFLRVMVVCENREMRRVLQNQLEQFQFIVSTVETGQEAIGLMDRSDPFDLVIVQSELQDLDSARLAMNIKTAKPNHSPILARISAYYESEQIEGMQAHPIESMIQYPMSQSRLYDHIVDLMAPRAAIRPPIDSDLSKGYTYSLLRDSTLLLVEDNEINQLIAKELLSEVVKHVDVAANGEEAIARAHTKAYDAILMDLHMPGMDGYETTKQIRSMPHGQSIPIIAITADAFKEVEERVLAVGMDAYITKPIDLVQLTSVLQRFIQLTKAAKEMTAAAIYVGKTEHGSSLQVEKALIQIGGNKRLYHALLTKFRNNHASDVERIQIAVSANDWDQAAVLAHTLKGVAANIGAVNLSHIAGQLQNALLEQNLAIIPPLIHQSMEELNSVLRSSTNETIS